MKRWVAVSVLLVVLLSVVFLRPSFSKSELGRAGMLTIEGVTLVDVSGHGANKTVSVTIENERIAAVRPAGAGTPAKGTVVDGRGKFLIPGLWDMHVHWSARPTESEHYGRLLVANGVTGVRKMNSGVRRRGNGRGSVWNPAALEPRAFASGPMVNGGGGLGGRVMVVSNPSQVPTALDSLFGMGADFVKVYNGVPRAAYFAVLREAARRGKAVAGHVPWSVTVGEASDSGQRSVEHLTGILMSCSSRETELRAELSSAHEVGEFEERMPGQRAEAASVRSYDPQRCRKLAEQLAANGTWVVPTLATASKKATVGEVSAAAYMPGWERMNEGRRSWWSQRPASERERLQSTFALEESTVAMLRDAGVPLLAGSDMPAALVVPGFSLHDELVLLVQSGLTPLEALQAATIQPARYFEALDSLGTISVGKAADMVLLDADPLRDIRNTRRIAGVVLRGRYFDRKQLDDMLAESRSFARRRTMTAQVTKLWCSVARCQRSD